MEGLLTWRALPVGDLSSLDPFIFLNHHGPQVFPPVNEGLPFGPHPHRGFETVTFIIDGDVAHRDSTGGESVIKEGGIQWMTAGSGLIHAEVSSHEFLKTGGNEEVLQLWVNLPAAKKMTAPAYYGYNKNELPLIKSDDSKVEIQVIAGNISGTTGPVQPFSGVNLARVNFAESGSLRLTAPEGENIFCYCVSGTLKINDEEVHTRNLVHFSGEGTEVEIHAAQKSILLWGHAKPFNEPVVAYGPFVMNTEAEIRQAMQDYQNGKMGVWKE